jgi:hypothetical protein
MFSILSACSEHSVIKHGTRFFSICKCLRNPVMSKMPTLVYINWSRVLSENHKYPRSRVTRFLSSHDIYDRTLVRKKNAVHSFWCFGPSQINSVIFRDIRMETNHVSRMFGWKTLFFCPRVSRIFRHVVFLACPRNVFPPLSTTVCVPAPLQPLPCS